MRDSKAYSYQSETRHYSKSFPTDLGPLGKVVEALPDGIIEDLDRADKSKPEGNRILDPIEFRTPLGDIRINLRLQDSKFEGHKVRGPILYQVQVRPKNGKATRQLAEEAFKWFIAYQIAKQMAVQAAKGGKSGQSQSQPVDQPVPATPRTSSSSSSTSTAGGEDHNWVLWGLSIVVLGAIALTGLGAIAEGGVLRRGAVTGTAAASSTTTTATS